MTRYSACPLALAFFFVVGCQSDLSAMELPSSSSPSVDFNDVSVEMRSCEITPDRSARCRLRITNRYTDKGIEVWRDVRIQDDLGSEYRVAEGGFGENPKPSGQRIWSQLAVADSSYPFTVVAKNLSTRATSIRAVVFQRFLARDPGGGTLGYRDKVVFRSPAMVGAAPRPRTGPRDVPLPGPAIHDDVRLRDGWQDVGYWNYDGVDGQSLPKGLIFRAQPGGAFGRSWSGHLELTNHAALPPRARALWPVRIHPGRRQICADYPGYPSYVVSVDLPGRSQDGVYQVARCTGDD